MNEDSFLEKYLIEIMVIWAISISLFGYFFIG